jgi:hypothetical protein
MMALYDWLSKVSELVHNAPREGQDQVLNTFLVRRLADEDPGKK